MTLKQQEMVGRFVHQKVEQAFQQELLDLLLAQPYTQKNPVEQEEPMTVS